MWRALLPATMLLVVAACCSDRSARPADSRPDTSTGASSDGPWHVPWHVFDNGTRCITFPCASLTARRGTEEVRITGLDLTPLALSPDDEQALREALRQGKWLVRGAITEGARGPGGPGVVLRVDALAGPATP